MYYVKCVDESYFEFESFDKFEDIKPWLIKHKWADYTYDCGYYDEDTDNLTCVGYWSFVKDDWIFYKGKRVEIRYEKYNPSPPEVNFTMHRTNL